MAWFTAIVLIGILSFLVVDHSDRLSSSQRADLQKWYLGWLVRGVAVPVGVWVLFNSGVFDRLPSLTMESNATHVISLGVFAIATYWAALTAGWLLVTFYTESESQKEFKHSVTLWSIFLGPLGLLIVLAGGWFFAGLGMAIWLMSLLAVVNSLEPARIKKPTYSRAIARMHLDKYEEAEMAVINDLEKCEEDFDGWMLLAELYAVHFHDLNEAERTIRETCAHPATTDSQRSIALHKLADWHLKFGADPVAARNDLETICEMAPNTHLARMARLRLNQLPASKEEWLREQKGKTYHLPALRSDFDSAAPDGGAPAQADAASRAKQFTERLHRDPNDTSAREELARLLAEKLGKVDAGLEQLELLLTIPDQPVEKLAEWLALMASWQFRLKRNEPAARKILERLMQQFPQTAQGFAAQRRLNLMDWEAKARARAATPAPPKISLLPS
jgi:hypothetical protein